MSVENSSYKRMLKEQADKKNQNLLGESHNSDNINPVEDYWKNSSPELVKNVSDHEEFKQAPAPSNSQNSVSTSQKPASDGLAQLSNSYKPGDGDPRVNQREDSKLPQDTFASEKDEGNLDGFELQLSCGEDCLVIEAVKKNPFYHYEKKIDKELMKELFGKEVLEIFDTPESLKNCFEQAKNSGNEGDSLRISMNNEALIKLKFEESFIPTGKVISIQLENKIVGFEEVSKLYINRIGSLSESILLPENSQRLGEINLCIQKQCQNLKDLINSSTR